MKSKKEIEFWDVNDIYEYALKSYQIEEYDDYKDSAIQKIKRTLKKYGFPLVKKDSSHEKYEIPTDIAKYIVDDILYDYFIFSSDSDKVKKNREERAEQRRQRLLKDMETKSLEKDKNLEISTGSAEIASLLYDEMKKNPNFDSDGKMREKLDSSKWKTENFIKLSDNSKIPKKDLAYHIPDFSVDELDNETVDRIIDRMMIRAVFDLFYDFDEKAFRTALYERAAHIKEKNEGGVKPVSGYSELTRRLENPYNNFINEKNKG